SSRRQLPAFQYGERIMDLIRNNQVLVLSGETGCGKYSIASQRVSKPLRVGLAPSHLISYHLRQTTQVPQLILDDAIRKSQTVSDEGSSNSSNGVNVLVTQPRRISAIGVADRVASERCEKVGSTVGYQIRLESRVSQQTQITFMTTGKLPIRSAFFIRLYPGILLRRLLSDTRLQGVTHVIVDEVHERQLDTDFLLIILRDLLQQRSDLKVVLMSATLQSDLFSTYFGRCATIAVPGRTFPVESLFLEE
ncbi:unnamed protein product, partial [Chrysoparadoxa australica]